MGSKAAGQGADIARAVVNYTLGRPLWVKPGKAQSEQILSALPPLADSDADMLERQRSANNGLMHCNMRRKKKDRLAAISTKSDGLF